MKPKLTRHLGTKRIMLIDDSHLELQSSSHDEDERKAGAVAPFINSPVTNKRIADFPERASVSVHRLATIMKSRGLQLEIAPFWTRRVRYGHMFVFDDSEPTRIQAQAQFTRATHSWRDADTRLGVVRTGSPKHVAVLEVLAQLRRS
jgi:hypothetical protein